MRHLPEVRVDNRCKFSFLLVPACGEMLLRQIWPFDASSTLSLRMFEHAILASFHLAYPFDDTQCRVVVSVMYGLYQYILGP
jgi:hypothetical protein